MDSDGKGEIRRRARCKTAYVSDDPLLTAAEFS